ncbi:flagellar assembly protein FliW [Peribacillus acanthi]|uniref:flagellar assembly protein FliW n=1 Tax=Peribacillus acanthi TaxID=2171554 RepID=UPI000D3E8432|nr:flagellar assembly protein FliW [Peribacillus acanthi]
MKINTKYHETIEIDENLVIHFDNGIPGLPEYKRFVLLPLSDDGVYQVLQSLDNQEIGFVVVNPFFVKPDYDITLDDKTVQQLEIENEIDVNLVSIITLRDPFNNSTLNLAAPVVVNITNRKAKQVILQNTNYSIREPLHVLVEKG